MRKIYIVLYFHDVVFVSGNIKACFNFIHSSIPTYAKQKLVSYCQFTRYMSKYSRYRLEIADGVGYTCLKSKIHSKSTI